MDEKEHIQVYNHMFNFQCAETGSSTKKLKAENLSSFNNNNKKKSVDLVSWF